MYPHHDGDTDDDMPSLEEEDDDEEAIDSDYDDDLDIDEDEDEDADRDNSHTGMRQVEMPRLVTAVQFSDDSESNASDQDHMDDPGEGTQGVEGVVHDDYDENEPPDMMSDDDDSMGSDGPPGLADNDDDDDGPPGLAPNPAPPGPSAWRGEARDNDDDDEDALSLSDDDDDPYYKSTDPQRWLPRIAATAQATPQFTRRPAPYSQPSASERTEGPEWLRRQREEEARQAEARRRQQEAQLQQELRERERLERERNEREVRRRREPPDQSEQRAANRRARARAAQEAQQANVGQDFLANERRERDELRRKKGFAGLNDIMGKNKAAKDAIKSRVGRCCTRPGGLAQQYGHHEKCCLKSPDYHVTKDDKHVKMICSDGCNMVFHKECWSKVFLPAYRAFIGIPNWDMKDLKTSPTPVNCPTNSCAGLLLKIESKDTAVWPYDAKEEVRTIIEAAKLAKKQAHEDLMARHRKRKSRQPEVHAKPVQTALEPVQTMADIEGMEEDSGAFEAPAADIQEGAAAEPTEKRRWKKKKPDKGLQPKAPVDEAGNAVLPDDEQLRPHQRDDMDELRVEPKRPVPIALPGNMQDLRPAQKKKKAQIKINLTELQRTGHVAQQVTQFDPEAPDSPKVAPQQQRPDFSTDFPSLQDTVSTQNASKKRAGADVKKAATPLIDFTNLRAGQQQITHHLLFENVSIRHVCDIHKPTPEQLASAFALSIEFELRQDEGMQDAFVLHSHVFLEEQALALSFGLRDNKVDAEKVAVWVYQHCFKRKLQLYYPCPPHNESYVPFTTMYYLKEFPSQDVLLMYGCIPMPPPEAAVRVLHTGNMASSSGSSHTASSPRAYQANRAGKHAVGAATAPVMHKGKDEVFRSHPIRPSSPSSTETPSEVEEYPDWMAGTDPVTGAALPKTQVHSKKGKTKLNPNSKEFIPTDATEVRAVHIPPPPPPPPRPPAAQHPPHTEAVCTEAVRTEAGHMEAGHTQSTRRSRRRAPRRDEEQQEQRRVTSDAVQLHERGIAQTEQTAMPAVREHADVHPHAHHADVQSTAALVPPPPPRPNLSPAPTPVAPVRRKPSWASTLIMLKLLTVDDGDWPSWLDMIGGVGFALTPEHSDLHVLPREMWPRVGLVVRHGQRGEMHGVWKFVQEIPQEAESAGRLLEWRREGEWRRPPLPAEFFCEVTGSTEDGFEVALGMTDAEVVTIHQANMVEQLLAMFQANGEDGAVQDPHPVELDEYEFSTVISLSAQHAGDSVAATASTHDEDRSVVTASLPLESIERNPERAASLPSEHIELSHTVAASLPVQQSDPGATAFVAPEVPAPVLAPVPAPVRVDVHHSKEAATTSRQTAASPGQGVTQVTALTGQFAGLRVRAPGFESASVQLPQPVEVQRNDVQALVQDSAPLRTRTSGSVSTQDEAPASQTAVMRNSGSVSTQDHSPAPPTAVQTLQSRSLSAVPHRTAPILSQSYQTAHTMSSGISSPMTRSSPDTLSPPESPRLHHPKHYGTPTDSRHPPSKAHQKKKTADYHQPPPPPPASMPMTQGHAAYRPAGYSAPQPHMHPAMQQYPPSHTVVQPTPTRPVVPPYGPPAATPYAPPFMKYLPPHLNYSPPNTTPPAPPPAPQPQAPPAPPPQLQPPTSTHQSAQHAAPPTQQPHLTVKPRPPTHKQFAPSLSTASSSSLPRTPPASAAASSPYSSITPQFSDEQPGSPDTFLTASDISDSKLSYPSGVFTNTPHTQSALSAGSTEDPSAADLQVHAMGGGWPVQVSGGNVFEHKKHPAHSNMPPSVEGNAGHHYVSHDRKVYAGHHHVSPDINGHAAHRHISPGINGHTGHRHISPDINGHAADHRIPPDINGHATHHHVSPGINGHAGHRHIPPNIQPNSAGAHMYAASSSTNQPGMGATLPSGPFPQGPVKSPAPTAFNLRPPATMNPGTAVPTGIAERQQAPQSRAPDLSQLLPILGFYQQASQASAGPPPTPPPNLSQ